MKTITPKMRNEMVKESEFLFAVDGIAFFATNDTHNGYGSFAGNCSGKDLYLEIKPNGEDFGIEVSEANKTGTMHKLAPKEIRYFHAGQDLDRYLHKYSDLLESGISPDDRVDKMTPEMQEAIKEVEAKDKFWEEDRAYTHSLFESDGLGH